jgi:Ca2+/Na+ antiporter
MKAKIEISISRYLLLALILTVLAILLIILGSDKLAQEEYWIAAWDYSTALFDLVVAVWNYIIHFKYYND